METFARIAPNKLGQPMKLSFGVQALGVMGAEFGQRVSVTLDDDVLTIALDPDAPHVLRAYTRKKGGRPFAPYLSLGELLAQVSAGGALDRAPRHALASPGQLRVFLRQAITEEEYRYRRWRDYARQDDLLDQQGALDLANRSKTHERVPVVLQRDLANTLRDEAAAMKLTLPAYLAHVLGAVDRSQVAPPTAQNNRASAELVKLARKVGSPLTAAEMIERGIIPASDETWLRARVAEGMSYAEMAASFGGSSSVYSKWARHYEISVDRSDRLRQAWANGKRVRS